MATIVFAGTSDFSCPTLLALAKKHDVIHVFSQPDKPVGRKKELKPTPVKELCEKLNLSYSQPGKIQNDEFWQNPPDFDFLVTASFGQIIPEKVLKMPKKDALNIHGSLLPKYRGASPIQEALLNGDSLVGVSIMRMVSKLDAGDVFLQQELEITDEEMYEALHEKLAGIGAQLLLKVIENYDSIKPLAQDENDATRCRKISRADGEVSFDAPAIEIYNKWRAFTPWPGIFTYFDGMRLKILGVSYMDDEHQADHGLVYRKGDDVCIACSGHSALVLKQVQLEGKTSVEINGFILGQPEFIGSVLGK
jgi:methionyl-tRNA formyltransferase